MPPRACPLVTTTAATEAAIEGANRAHGSIDERNESAASAPAARKPKRRHRKPRCRTCGNAYTDDEWKQCHVITCPTPISASSFCKKSKKQSHGSKRL